MLRIAHVTKRHMGIYQCIASNGVPPAVSKRVAVTVLCKLSSDIHRNETEAVVNLESFSD